MVFGVQCEFYLRFKFCSCPKLGSHIHDILRSLLNMDYMKYLVRISPIQFDPKHILEGMGVHLVESICGK